jgi:3',5'-nucleoside bisphosphate phosphatase
MPKPRRRPSKPTAPAPKARSARPRPVRADLHLHTTASDSRWTPEQVVAGCKATGIGLLAVADHDTVDAVLTTERLALEAGLAFLRAVEVSSLVGDTMLHIIGYGIDPADPLLRGVLAENRANMEAFNDRDIRDLIALGYDLDYDEYLNYDYERTRGGFRSLNYCLDKGICTGPRDFFTRVRDQLGHRRPNFVHPRDAVRAIEAAGGIPVLAHPGVSLENYGGLTPEVLDPLLSDGVRGLEAYSQYHDQITTSFCVDWCEAHDLVITGGSDYHGGFVGRQLGIPLVDTSQLRLGPLEAQIRRPSP